MDNRDKILQRVKQTQRLQDVKPLPFSFSSHDHRDPLEQFKDTLIAIGGSVFEIDSLEEVDHYVIHLFPKNKNVVTFLPGHKESMIDHQHKSHDFQNVGLAVLFGEFAVAENGAIWITDKNMLDRALPFICERLILVVNRNEIVQTLHEAYLRIEIAEYHYGTFIAGPSKTADIEQSLVLGAHGPKSLTVLLL